MKNKIEKTREELIKSLQNLQQDYNSMKELLEQEINRLKEAEEESRKSEEKYRKAYMTSPDSININRLSDGLYVSINEGFTRIMGYSEEEVIGRTSLELNVWANPDDRRDLVNELNLKGEVKNLESRFVAKDGSIINGLIAATLIDLDGVPHILSVIRDITIRKKAEEALAYEQYLMEALMNNLPDHIYFKDLESRFIRINKDHAKSFGLSDPSQAIGKTDFDFFSQEHAHQAYEDEQTIIRTGQLLSREEKLTWANRPDTWSFTTKLPMFDKDGKIIGTFGISRDITEHMRKDMESQVLFEITQGITTTDNLDELLVLIHRSISKVLYAENIFVALYDQDTGLFSFPYFIDKFDGPPSPTTMGKSCTSYVFRTAKPLILTQPIFDRLKEQNEVELVGSPSPSWIGIPLITPSKTIGVLVFQDYEKEDTYTENDLRFIISIGSQIALSIERKKDEEEIRLKNEMLQTINAEKDKFFSILAHDLRGPLSAFVEVAQILSDDIQNMTPDEIRDITTSMKTESINIYSLLENLLEWSRLKRGLMEFNIEKLNLKSTIVTGIEVVFESAKKKRIAVDISVADELDVNTDKHMFETVVRNIVSNAIKFTTAGGKVIISAFRNKENHIEIRICDSGIGMTTELKNKLFLLNEKTGRKGTDGEPSSGLGLLLCKEFIEKLGGKISVESEVGKGSTFSFSI
jgi:PAS domain S-box-containing protein